MLQILQETLIDTIKLLPFLFLTYLLMEYIENKTSENLKDKIKKAGKFGPFFGSLVGIIPQCGFSASSTNLYRGRLISIGTLMAVYLSTSDEMIPIFLSEAVPISTILKILAIKLVLGIFFGFLIDFIYNILTKNKEPKEEIDLCEQEHCHCHEDGILKSSLKHTLNIIIYIFVITLIINIIIWLVGEDKIETFIQSNSALGPVISSLIGLIPNCAASVLITNLYLKNVFNMASLIAGLLTGAGVGLIVLFRINKKNLKENLSIVGLLYVIGVISGWGMQMLNFIN